jgi:hypothetical protein
MIRDKGSNMLSLSPVDPEKIGNSTKTGNFHQCPPLELQRLQSRQEIQQATRMNPTSPR